MRGTFLWKNLLHNYGSIMLLLMSIQAPAVAQEWKQIYPSWKHFPIECMLHWNGDTVFSAGRAWTLIRSTDAGSTWDEMYGDGTHCYISFMTRGHGKIYLHPEFNCDTTQPGLRFYSFSPWTDTMHEYSAPFIGGTGDLPDFPYIHAAGEFIYVIEPSTDTSFIHRSNDGGNAWEVIPVPHRLHLFQCLTDSIALYICEDRNRERYLYRSSDGGVNWTGIRNMEYNAPVVIDTLWDEGGLHCLMGCSLGAWISEDSGKTWVETGAIPWNSAMAGAAHASRDHWYVIGQSSNIYETSDSGSTWTMLKGISKTQSSLGKKTRGILHFESDVILAATEEGNFYRSTDNGASWPSVRMPAMRRIFELHFYDEYKGMAIAQTAGEDTAWFATEDGGKSWELTGREHLFRAQYRAFDDLRAWSAENQGDSTAISIWKSINQGRAWSLDQRACIPKQTNPAYKTQFYTYDSLYVAVFFQSTQFAFFISKDLGASWLESTSPPMSWPSSRYWFIIEQASRGTADCYFFSIGPNSINNLFVSTDSCRTWRGTFDTLQFPLKALIEFDAVNDTLFLRANVSGIQEETIFMSPDNGESWSILVSNNTGGGAPWTIENEYFLPRIFSFYSVGEIRRTDDAWQNLAYRIRTGFFDNGPYFFLNSETAWIAGCNVIFGMAPSPPDGVGPPPVPDDNAGLQAPYPNPVKHGETAMIGLRRPVAVPGNAAMRVSIYNIIGREVAVLFSGPAGFGAWTLPWKPAPSLPAGVYIVRMTLDGHVWMKPVVVVK